jgi:hypothetical protein
MLGVPSKRNIAIYPRFAFLPLGKNAGSAFAYRGYGISLLGGKSHAFFGAWLSPRTFLFGVKRYAESHCI